jgi:hypothetical protein
VNFKYEYKVDRMIKAVIQSVKPTAELHTKAVYEINNICPRCRQGFKVYSNTIKNVGAVSLFMQTNVEPNRAIPYCICSDCTKALNKRFAVVIGQFHDPLSEAAETYLIDMVSPSN